MADDEPRDVSAQLPATVAEIFKRQSNMLASAYKNMLGLNDEGDGSFTLVYEDALPIVDDLDDGTTIAYTETVRRYDVKGEDEPYVSREVKIKSIVGRAEIFKNEDGIFTIRIGKHTQVRISGHEWDVDVRFGDKIGEF